MTLRQAPLRQAQGEGGGAKIGLGQQIACVRREIALRKSVYPGLVAKGKKKRSEAEYEIACMEATLKTLHWLQLHEATIRAAVKEPTGGAADA